MKNVGLFSLIMLVAIALSNNLSAGPVYAAKWKRPLQDGRIQTVLLYGDDHDTHRTDENREQQAIEAFCQELRFVKEETLVLCEALRASIFTSILSHDDIKAYDPLWNKKFMRATSDFAQTMSNQSHTYVSTQGLETRQGIFEVTPMALGYNKFLTLSPKQERNKKAFDAIKDYTLAEIFERPIVRVKNYSQLADNSLTKGLFGGIAAAMQTRKTVLWNKIVADTGLSFQELDRLTIDTIVSNAWMNKAYGNLLIFLTVMAEPLGRCYSESLDAEALWLIAEIQKPCSKIIMIAGWAHTHNLEKYLLALGFVKNHVEGHDYTTAYNAAEKSQCYLRNLVDAQHASRVSPLDPLDWFGQYLYRREITGAQQQFDLSSATNRSEEHMQALYDHKIKVEIMDNFNPVPLVPCETFKWISESDQTDEEESSWQNLEREPEAKQRRIEEAS